MRTIDFLMAKRKENIMKTIEFDLEKAKSGEYEIETENGLPVRIVCWDKQDGVFKIVGLVKNRDGYEFCQSYDEHGSAHEDDTAFDLRLVCPDPVSELTDFEYAVGKEIYGEQRFVLEVDGGNNDIINGAKESAARLYELAKKQFASDMNLKDVRYDSLERRDDTDIINEHITDTKLSDEVNTRLKKCGWFVCDNAIMKRLRDEIERMVEMTDFIIKDKS